MTAFEKRMEVGEAFLLMREEMYHRVIPRKKYFVFSFDTSYSRVMNTAKVRFGKPTSVRFTKEVDAALKEASEATNIDKQDIIRLACAIGLEELKEINYDLPKSVHYIAKSLRGTAPTLEDLSVALERHASAKSAANEAKKKQAAARKHAA